MTIDLYSNVLSPPCRAVLLLGEALGISFNLKEMDLMKKKDHLKPEFIAINPQHTIPTIVDEGFALWESRAILAYLVETYGKNDSLHPKDPKIRAKVDRILNFDMGTLYARTMGFVSPIFFRGEKPDPKKLEEVYEALGWLDLALEGHFFAVSNRITIADISLVASISILDASGIDLHNYPRVSAWYTRCGQQMKGYDKVFKEAVETTRRMMKGKLKIIS